MSWKITVATLAAALALGSHPLFARDLARDEWYVRFILTSDTGGLEDSYNTLGQLVDALPGFDEYDLPELGQTWPGTYLSVIFFRPDWETARKTYNTDYHPVPAKNNTPDDWTFEVRSDDPARALSLTWEGGNTKLKSMVLVDLQEGTAVAAAIDGVTQTYHFTMNGTVRQFAWRVLTNKDFGQFLLTGELPAITTATTLTANTSLKKSNWLPMGWGQGQGKGYLKEKPEGLPDDPFAD